MRRVYIEPDLLVEGELQLPEEAARYLARVLRLEVGTEVELFDGAGRRARARLVAVERRAVRCEVSALNEDAVVEGPRISSAIPLIKGERLDLAVRMLTELGVVRIVLVDCQRSVVRWGEDTAGRLARLQRVSQAAARQSGRSQLPELLPPQAFNEFVERRVGGLALFGDVTVGDTAERASGSIVATPAEDILLCTGPEGGFTASERELLLRQGFLPMALGPHVLRAETAAVTAVATVRALLPHRRAAADLQGGPC